MLTFKGRFYIINLAVEEIEKQIDRLNASLDDGEISHWHIVFFKNANGKITWMFSKPEIEEIEINQYLI